MGFCVVWNVGELNSRSKQEQSNLDAVTTHRAWRHTVGRISCSARLPIYALGTLGQGLKTVIKAFVSPVVSFGRWATSSKKLESWSFTGVAKDAIMTGSLAEARKLCFVRPLRSSKAIPIVLGIHKTYRECCRVRKTSGS